VGGERVERYCGAGWGEGRTLGETGKGFGSLFRNCRREQQKEGRNISVATREQ